MFDQLLRRGAYFIPALHSATVRPVILCIDHRHRLVDILSVEPHETDDSALARAETYLDGIDPLPPTQEPG